MNFIEHALVHWRFFRRYRVLRLRQVLTVLVLSTLAIVAEASGLALLLPIMSFVEHGRDVAKFSASSSLAREMVRVFQSFGVPVSLLSLSTIAMSFIILRQAINLWAGLQSEKMKWEIGRRLSVRYTEAILGSTGTHLRTYKPGRFTVEADQECQASAAIARTYISIWTTAVAFSAYGSILFLTNPKASILAATVIVLVLFSLRSVLTRTHKLADAGMSFRREQVDFLNERFRAWKLIKLANTLPLEVSKADAIAARIADNRIGLAWLAGLVTLSVTPILSGFLLLTLYIFVEVFVVDISTIVLFGAVLLRLAPLAQSAQGHLQRLNQLEPSLNAIDNAISQATVHRENLDCGEFAPVLKDAIFLENVSYNYPGGGSPALSSIIVKIPVGRLTAIVGPSGAGKSTFVDLIPRIIVPTAGQIYFDDVPIDKIALRSLRSMVAFVSQEPFLFDASVADNIRYQRRDASDAAVVEAARLANAIDFIEKMPGGFSASLGDAGLKLSGGQKQRIALARAFLSEAKVLILDEPTSALDYESEAAIQRAIDDMVHRHSLTAIIIAHRLSTVRNADFVIRLSSGQIVHSGTAAEVLSQLGSSDNNLGLRAANPAAVTTR